MIPSSLCPSHLLLFALTLALAASQTLPCDKPVANCDPGIDRFPKENRIEIKHASKTIPKVTYDNNFVDVDIQSDNLGFKYRFVVCGCDGIQSTDRQVVFINPISLYIEESPSLALYHFLVPDNIGFIKAVQNRDFIFNSDIRSQITNGLIDEVTEVFDIDYAKIRAVNPALSIIGTFKVEQYMAEVTDIPYLVAAESQEQNPLARAEWLKLFGLLVDQTEKANKEFQEIEKRYNETKKKAAQITRRPAVFFNYPSGTNNPALTLDERYDWNQPVKDEYTVQFIRDANADYRYADEDPTAGTSGKLVNISTIVRDFRSADYLIQSSRFPGSSNRTLEDYLKEMVSPADADPDIRKEVEKLKAVRCVDVWSHQNRVTADGTADDFFEAATLRPDDVLADFMQALHPDVDFGKRETVYIYRYAETASVPNRCPFTVLNNAAEGSVLLDKKYQVPGKDRFQVADELEKDVLPKLRESLNGERFDVFFANADASNEETVVTVRVEVKESGKDTFDSGSTLVFAMIDGLGAGVRELKDGQVVEPPEQVGGDGGLRGGAVAGIVIAVIIGVVLLVYILLLRRKRSRRLVYASEGPADYWDETDVAGGRDNGDLGPFA